MTQQGGDAIASTASPIQRDRNERTELSLGHCAQTEQRHLRHLRTAQLLLNRKVTDLRPVAMYDDHAPAGVEQRADWSGHRRGVLTLLVIGPALTLGNECVSPEGDYRGPGHDPSLRWTICRLSQPA